MTKKNYSTIQTTDFQNILRNIICWWYRSKKVMSILHAIKLGGEVVHKDRSVSTGAFSLKGHDSSYIMSAKRAILKVPTLGRESTTHTHTHAHTHTHDIYTGCPRRNVPDFGRVFLMLNYTDITQNT